MTILPRRILKASLPLLVACRSQAPDPSADAPSATNSPSAAPAASTPAPSPVDVPSYVTIPMPPVPAHPTGQVVTKKELRDWLATDPMRYCGPGPIRHDTRFTGGPTLHSRCYGSPDNTCLDRKAPQLRRLMLAGGKNLADCLVEGPTVVPVTPAQPPPRGKLAKTKSIPVAQPQPHQWCCYTLLTPGLGRPLLAQGTPRVALLRVGSWG